MKTIRDWLERAEHWKGVGELVQNSPAIQEAISDLTRSLMTNDGGNFRWDAVGIAGHLGELTDYAEKSFDLFGQGLSGLKGLPTPSLPSFHFLEAPLSKLPSVSLPGFGGGSGGGGGGGGAFGYVLVGVLLVVILGIVLWQVITQLSNRGGDEAAKGWNLGPWPVNPGAVASREELLKAFEYLSLLLLGPAARSWNHLDIAAGLGTEAERRVAADRLAALYELVRYAPGEEPLSGEALAEARRNLCYLAGVAAA
jgi:hypothetical protein